GPRGWPTRESRSSGRPNPRRRKTGDGGQSKQRSRRQAESRSLPRHAARFDRRGTRQTLPMTLLAPQHRGGQGDLLQPFDPPTQRPIAHFYEIFLGGYFDGYLLLGSCSAWRCCRVDLEVGDQQHLEEVGLAMDVDDDHGPCLLRVVGHALPVAKADAPSIGS